MPATTAPPASLELLSPDWEPGLELFLEMLKETAPTEAELQN